MSTWRHRFVTDAAEWRSAGLERRRRVVRPLSATTAEVDGKMVTAYASNDYLGLSRDPRLIEAVAAGARLYGVGAEGRGSVQALGLQSSAIVYMGTLGKSAGLSGAFIAADRLIIDRPIQRARLATYRDRLQRASSAWKPYRLLCSATAIQPLIIGDNVATVEIADALLREGLWVPAIRPPTVPQGSARLRITLSAAHSAADIDCLCKALSQVIATSAANRA